MKINFFGALAAGTLLFSPLYALADGPGDAFSENAPSVAVEDNWSGFRFGLTYSVQTDSETRAYDPGPILVFTNRLEGDQVLGGFIGYDRQFNNVVLGAELQSVPQENYFPGSTTSYMSGLTSARVRVGYASGDSLFYASLGYAEGSLIDPLFPYDGQGRFWE